MRKEIKYITKLKESMILIIDNGSQYTHLIKRNCRDMDFEAVIVNDREKNHEIKGYKKIIISGGPSSVATKKEGLSERAIRFSYENEIPLLGICFGHQLIAKVFGGEVQKGKAAEYGISEITVDEEDLLFRNTPKKQKVWVSHFDEVKRMPKDFVKLAHSETCEIEAMRHRNKNIFSTQFHPEVWHTEFGERILENFLNP